jgi:hypothetical protein
MPSLTVTKKTDVFCERDRRFESISLQRRVSNELFPALGAHDAVGRDTTKETGALLLSRRIADCLS